MYLELFNKSLIAERDVQEERGFSEQSKMSRFDLGRQSISSGGYPSQSGKSFSSSKSPSKGHQV